MKQALLVEPRHIVLQEVAQPNAGDLKEHEVLLRILRIGICGSEIHSYRGSHPATFYPVVQGHEYSAEVIATGSAVTVVRAGDLATARPQLVCGQCNPCRRGQYNVCEHLRVQAFQADGAAQEYFVVTDDRVVRILEGITPDAGAMTEPVAVGAHATQRAGDLTGKNVVVSGAGTIGNMVAQFALARHARKVLITDISDYRLEVARACGIIHTLNVSCTPLEEYVHEFFGDEGYQVAFEVAGVESSIRSLMASIEKGGRIVVVAVFGKDPALSMFHLGEHELELIGTMMYCHEDFEGALRAIAQGKIRLEPLMSKHFPFEQFDEAYRYIEANPMSSMKILIDVAE
ncbi:zinc-dependent alcohol dehydrogenase [Alistipes shahii]|uniref:zinc-dependent alcohol dehydrogenase n=1 Tax=Alistipes shahii TaxID=328814 RepID=UPI003FD7F3F6